MKNKNVLFGLAFALALSLLFSSCTGGGMPEDSTAVTSAGATTAETTVPPESSDADETTTPEETSEDTQSETQAVTPEAESFTFLKSSKSESLLPQDEETPLCEERDLRLAAEYGVAIRERISNDIISAASAGYKSGAGYELLLLDAVGEGSQLVCAGVLENLSAAGISLTADSPCAISGITSELEYAGKTFLLSYRGLCGDLKNAYVLEFDEENALTAALTKAFSEGGYTFSRFLSDMNEADAGMQQYISVDDRTGAAFALLRSAGGRVMLPGSVSAPNGPEVNISSDSFKNAYTTALNVASLFDSDDTPVRLCRITDVSENAVLVLPLPEAETGAGYITPVHADRLTVVASPAGLVYGSRAADVLAAIAECTKPIRADILAFPGSCAEKSAEIIENSLHTDTAGIYTWGDLLPLASADIAACKTYASFMEEKDLKNRIKVAGLAASIIQERLAG